MTPGKYEAIGDLSPADVDAILRRGDPGELLYVPLSVGLHAEDAAWAQEVCIGLAAHADERVRGNALLGLGHVARVHGTLDRARVQPLLEAGLTDASEWVRGQAQSAVGDVEHFLGWRLVDDPLRDWFEGKQVPGVGFRLNDPVRIVEGEHAGQLATVVWWNGPERPVGYIVELVRDGSDASLPETALRPAPPDVAAQGDRG